MLSRFAQGEEASGWNGEPWGGWLVVPINFRELIGQGDVEGARKTFEALIVQLAYQKHQAVGVLARPGDWGIDAFAGRLDGEIAIWQAKFFLDAVDKSQRAQIRESLASALKAANERDHQVRAWTLCLPVDLDPEAQRWWETWKRKKEREHDLVIELWGATELEAMLLLPDAAHLARHFFPSSMGASPTQLPAKVLPLPTDHGYDDALFVRQLVEADITENESAKRQFFNYEALARDVADKADPTELQTLETLEAEIHAIWETRFAGASMDSETGKDHDFHSGVMEAIRSHFSADPKSLPPMSVVHHFGTMHRVVENGEAGWVSHFRKIAEAYRA